jgi:hypothetical protein
VAPPDRRRSRRSEDHDFESFRIRAEPMLEFFERMQDLGLERLLPDILKAANARSVVIALGDTRWRRLARWGIVFAAFAALATIASCGVSVATLALVLHGTKVGP